MALGLVAIILAGASFAWSIFWSVWQHRRLTKARLNVSLTFGTMTSGPAAWKPCADITASNGVVPVTLSAATFLVKGESGSAVVIDWAVQDPQPLPLLVGSGGHWMGMIEIEDLVRGFAHNWGPRSTWKVRAALSTPGGRKFRSKSKSRWPLLRAQWLKIS
jgi:hypothetical protein